MAPNAKLRRKASSREKRPYRSRTFDYALRYDTLNLRERPELYRIGRGEQGVLLVQPYKSEILPHWRFKTPTVARTSAAAITALFRRYARRKDFVGMDMARKFLQMGYTRARRYANHASGRKYSDEGALLPRQVDLEKAESARIFYAAWKRVEADATYRRLRALHLKRFG
jgi:hypothetical protein